ncbi:MAG TPA: SgcJ/EcaC family oxidoreductase [Gemmatimonadaceae bacterium]|nr:SgcJ/EcaC family oxidoreductase [Gemmatimonadaceae bacterium]
MNPDRIDIPERIVTAFVQAWNQRDPDALASLFDADAEFVNVIGLWWHDREAIRKAHAYGLERIFNRSVLRAGAVRVKSLSEDVAVVHTRMHLEGQTSVEGIAQPQPRRTIFSFVVHRTADGWRCASAQNTDVVPGAETNVVDDEGRLRSVDYRRGDRKE